MEHLSKQQVVLLCLLVSFATALATGITIFSLGEGSTSDGGQNIVYQVIEKTIAQVASDSPVREIIPVVVPAPQAPAQLSVSDIANKASASLVRVYVPVNGQNTPKFVTLGVVVAGGKIIAADDPDLVQGTNYSTVLSDGKQYQIQFVKELGSGLALLTIQDKTAAASVPVLPIISSSALNIGANVIAVGATEDNDVVSTGIIKEILSADQNSSKETTMITDFNPSTAIAGLMLLDTNANIIGFYTTSGDNSTTTPSSDEGVYVDASDVFSQTN